MGHSRPRPRRQWRRTFIRQWREFKGLTLEQLAERTGTTHASLSRLERGIQPYSQGLLESLAAALQTDVPSLLTRDPGETDGIWGVWEEADPAERRMIIDLARTVIKSHH